MNIDISNVAYYNARAQLLCCSLSLLFGDVLVAVCRRVLRKVPNREFKLGVYGKRQTAKIKLLPSVFSSLYGRIKIFVFLYDLFKDNMKRIEKQG